MSIRLLSRTALRQTCAPACPYILACRGLQSAPPAPAPAPVTPGPAFVFDIDGVLKQGEKVLPQARAALHILSGNNHLKKKYPFILLTNGGGSLESDRAERLSGELGVQIGEDQIVQSHTIFRSLAEKFGHKPVLVIGGPNDSCRKVATAYGFKHAYIPADIVGWKHAVWPFSRLTEREEEYILKEDFSAVKFAAVLVFHDSRDWGRDIQLTLDLVQSENGVFGTAKDPNDASLWKPEDQIPIYFSNPDLLWANDFPQPRLGQGALQESMAAVYKTNTGRELQRTTGGKPSAATYSFSSQLLSWLADPVDGKYDGRVYMVGDNPRSDIAGANAFGWESILVRTGVFRGEAESAEYKPTIVLPNALDGVLWALNREGEDGF